MTSRRPDRESDDALDEQLAETFPASDPPSLTAPQRPSTYPSPQEEKSNE